MGAKAKWDGAHAQINYRKRFIQNIDWYKKFTYALWLGEKTPHSILMSAAKGGADNVLELAGGRGDFSIYMLQSGIAKAVHMIDLSETAARVALEKANSKGVTGLSVEVADVDTVKIKGKYDLVAFSQALHHIRELEHVSDQISKSLKPGGCLYVSDYIGPTMMQWSNIQLELMNSLLQLIPVKLREQIGADGNISELPKSHIKRIPVETFLRVDPSEAVRSAEISKVLGDNFDVEFYPMAGAITYELFRGIAHNFDSTDENIIAIAKLIATIEYELTQSKVIEPNFGLFVCRKR